MKKLLLSLILLASPVLAEDFKIGVVGPFGGLNNSENTLTIPANMAQDLLNVDVTDGGKSIKKREGYAQAFALGVTSNPVHGTHVFYDSSGNDVVLAFNDTRMTASVSGASPTLLMSSATVDQTWQCVDSQGFAYCAGTSRDWIIKTNGATWSRLSGFTSTGTIVAVTPERLVQAGFSGSNSNVIHFSKANDFTTWTVGSTKNDPITFTITTPGSRITHLTYAHKKIYWFKESSFGYILEGEELSSWKPRLVSSEIGTLDNTSTQDTAGNLYFRGQDGHIYVTDGSNVEKISKDIPRSLGNGVRVENSHTITTGADWAAGTFSGNTVYVDTVTTPGNLQSTFPDTFITFRDGVGDKKQVWNYWSDSGVTVSTNQQAAGYLLVDWVTAAGTDMYGARSASRVGPLNAGTTFHLRIFAADPTSTSNSFGIAVSTHIATTGNALTEFRADGTMFLNIAWQSGTSYAFSGAQAIGRDTKTFPSTTFTLPVNLDAHIAASSYSITLNDVLFTSGTHSGGGVPDQNYVYLFARSVASASSFVALDKFSIAPQTFTFTSASHAIDSSISAWDTFAVTKNESAGTIAFALRQSISSTYTAVTAGGLPQFNPSTYWQLHSTFSVTSATETAPLSVSDITQNWIEGAAEDQVYSTFHDEKVMFSVAAGAGQATNNRVLVYDLITPGWTVYDLASNGFYKRNGNLYFGSSSAGYVYKFGGVDSDNGAAIEAYWKSKDFFMDSPFVDKEIVNISLMADSVTASSMTVTYTVNGSSSSAYTVALQSANTYARSNKNLPLGRVGNTLSIQFGNDATDQPFEVFALSYGYREKAWKPE